MTIISLLKYIKLYKRGRNPSNTHFNLTGIIDYTLKKNSKRKKKFKA